MIKVLMIDDNINNVKHLDQIGVKGILYKNNVELFAEIIKKKKP